MTETLHEATLESVGRSAETALTIQAGKKYTIYSLPSSCIFVEKIVRRVYKVTQVPKMINVLQIKPGTSFTLLLFLNALTT